MPRVVKKPPQRATRVAPARREPLAGAKAVATFRPGEPVPDADFIRLIVPAGTPEDAADAAEQLARARTPAVKVVREPDHRVAVPEALQGLGDEPVRRQVRTLRQVVEQRLARAEGVRTARPELAAALDEAMTAAGL